MRVARICSGTTPSARTRLHARNGVATALQEVGKPQSGPSLPMYDVRFSMYDLNFSASAARRRRTGRVGGGESTWKFARVTRGSLRCGAMLGSSLCRIVNGLPSCWLTFFIRRELMRMS